MGANVVRIEEALFDLEDLITLPEAEKILAVQNFNMTKAGIIRWLKKYPIGAKVGGRWFIHPDKLALLLQGKIGARLKPLK